MATGSQIDLCNRALLAIGARTTIASFDEGSTEADACSILWTPTFESLARTAQWVSLRKQAPLSLIAAAQGTQENPNGTSYPLPPTPWLYAYAYPADCLRLWWIVPSYPANTGSSVPPTTINNAAATWLPNQGQIPYQISAQPDINNNPTTIILTNQDLAQAVYCWNQPNPQNWDSLLQSAMVSSLAAYLVPALVLSAPLMQLQIKNAEQAITIARTADGNEGVTVMDHLPDWMAARAGGQGYGPGWNYNFTLFPYGVMNWPSYN